MAEFRSNLIQLTYLIIGNLTLISYAPSQYVFKFPKKKGKKHITFFISNKTEKRTYREVNLKKF